MSFYISFQSCIKGYNIYCIPLFKLQLMETDIILWETRDILRSVLNMFERFLFKSANIYSITFL